ncbi:hypothetical protein OGAPHI_000902 [Ogataea philodendri]|uniref:Uncharacterized protein n=1 Tax=Ogataea philodendri TaxID=1378263 RepID=A0A9P8PEH7_9ASCO|nr:uncharacterized protein OGAPHI_000902 [Ogataea philodendri]KAH3670387.1 hypothetical protein OGAPHI_000902 [Ogataea philodendri]
MMCLGRFTALAPGVTKMVCVSSKIRAGPGTTSPIFRSDMKYTLDGMLPSSNATTCSLTSTPLATGCCGMVSKSS